MLSPRNIGFIGHVARYGWWSLHPLRFASPPLSGEGNPLQPMFLNKILHQFISTNFEHLLIAECDVRQNPTAKLDFTYAVFLRKQKKEAFFLVRKQTFFFCAKRLRRSTLRNVYLCIIITTEYRQHTKQPVVNRCPAVMQPLPSGSTAAAQR